METQVYCWYTINLYVHWAIKICGCSLKRSRKFQPEDRLFSLSSVTSPAVCVPKFKFSTMLTLSVLSLLSLLSVLLLLLCVTNDQDFVHLNRTVFFICFTFFISKWKEKDVEILIYLANHCGANSIHEWTHLWLVYDRNSCCWLCWRGRRKEEFHILCIMRYELFSLFWSKL